MGAKHLRHSEAVARSYKTHPVGSSRQQARLLVCAYARASTLAAGFDFRRTCAGVHAACLGRFYADELPVDETWLLQVVDASSKRRGARSRGQQDAATIPDVAATADPC